MNGQIWVEVVSKESEFNWREKNNNSKSYRKILTQVWLVFDPAFFNKRKRNYRIMPWSKLYATITGVFYMQLWNGENIMEDLHVISCILDKFTKLYLCETDFLWNWYGMVLVWYQNRLICKNKTHKKSICKRSYRKHNKYCELFL